MESHKAVDYWSSLLLQIRKKNNWNQSHLADQLGVSRETVSRWESGSKYPSIEQQSKIGTMAESLNIASVYGIARVVFMSPFPMILTDKDDVVIAASQTSGFQTGMTVLEQTPRDEHKNYLDFSKTVKDTGFWDKADNVFEYEFIIATQKRKAIIQSVGSRGHIFALVQKL